MGNSLDKILPGLYVGGIRASSKEKILNDNKITHILSIHDKAAPYFKDRQYLCITANDNSGQDLTQFFSECNDFIHQARLNGGNVLVHCFAGISRSVTVTTAYIMTVTDLSWKEALKAIRGARNCANPNFGFQRQLLAFYHDCLYEEKGRLFTKFPRRLDYKDEEECRRLIKAHEEWILHGDEGPPGTPTKDEDENIYPLRHNAYGIKTNVQSANKSDKENEEKDEQGDKIGNCDSKSEANANKVDDEEDDEAYIDMSKNSFHKPNPAVKPLPKKKTAAGGKASAEFVIPSCSEQTVREYEDKLLSHTAKVMSHEKYHPAERSRKAQHAKEKCLISNNESGSIDSVKSDSQCVSDVGSSSKSQLQSTNPPMNNENQKSEGIDVISPACSVKDDIKHEQIVDELFSGNHRCNTVLVNHQSDGSDSSESCNNSMALDTSAVSSKEVTFGEQSQQVKSQEISDDSNHKVKSTDTVIDDFFQS